MSYRIKIEKIDTVTVIKKPWQKVADSGNARDGGVVYDYAPVEDFERETTTVLEQTIEDVDLKKVIKAINEIE